MLLRLPLAALFAVSVAAPVGAQDLQSYAIELKDHAFAPAEIHVPSGKPFLVVVKNSDGAAEEFEMLFPSVERVVQPGGQAQLRIRPLEPGRFPFFGENDPDDEKGAFISE